MDGYKDILNQLSRLSDEELDAWAEVNPNLRAIVDALPKVKQDLTFRGAVYQVNPASTWRYAGESFPCSGVAPLVRWEDAMEEGKQPVQEMFIDLRGTKHEEEMGYKYTSIPLDDLIRQ